VTAVATDSAWYVFGVVSADDVGRLRADAVEEGGLAALVAAVPLSDFGADVLPERLNDRAWLEQRARAHQDVLQAIAESATVVPFRFGTIYRETDDIRGMLRDRREVLVSSLERVRGKLEIGVKAWAPAEGRGTAAAAEDSGRSYLQSRLDTLQQSRRASSLLAEAAEAAHARLLACAVEGVANRPQPRELTGRSEPMILNGAYLVTDPEPLRAEAAALAAEYADRGIAFELTGPWPAYNFVDEEDAS
jgi:Gas vesicle synthesis protein GvpL/GvpF